MDLRRWGGVLGRGIDEARTCVENAREIEMPKAGGKAIPIEDFDREFRRQHGLK
jgi:hypothetical protein